MNWTKRSTRSTRGAVSPRSTVSPRRTAIAFAAALVGLATPLAAAAQAYPSKPIRYVVPFAPGGATDILARMVAQKLGEAWNVPVTVENRAGASGNVGTELVARAAPDGHTLLMTINSHTLNASLFRKLPYDPFKDFLPVSLVAVSPNVIAVPDSLPVRSVAELIAAAKARPAQLTYGSAGSGSGAHLAGELFQSMAGVKLVHVPYKGAGQVVTDLVGGQINMSFIVLPVVHPHAQTGKVRILAVTTASRSALVPTIPTVAESGMPGYEVVSWFGTFVPAGTPPEVVSRLSGEIDRILKLADVKAKADSLALELRGGSPDAFNRFIAADFATWDKVVKQLGLKLD